MKYTVTQRHCLDYKVGEVVELSEKMAKALKNKVSIYVEPVAAPKPAAKAKATKAKAAPSGEAWS